MKKTTRNLIILLVVLVLCVGAYVGARVYNDNQTKKAAADASASKITVIALSDIDELTWNNGTTTFTFAKSNGTWAYSDAAFPLDTSYPEAVASTLASLSAVRKMDQPADSLSAYGLAQPAFTLTAASGSQKITLLIGSASGANYYAKIDGQDAIYTIGSSLVTEIQHNLADMAKIDTFPTLSEKNMTAVSLSSGGKTLQLAKQTVESATDSSTATTGTDSSTTSSTGSSTQSVTYQWSGTQGGGSSSSNTSLSSLIKTLGALKFSACSAYNTAVGARTEYGVDTPTLSLTVQYTDDQGTAQTMTLAVGSATSSGDYYATLNGSTSIFTISKDTVTTLTGLVSGV
jgi:hypothetical protein